MFIFASIAVPILGSHWTNYGLYVILMHASRILHEIDMHWWKKKHGIGMVSWSHYFVYFHLMMNHDKIKYHIFICYIYLITISKRSSWQEGAKSWQRNSSKFSFGDKWKSPVWKKCWVNSIQSHFAVILQKMMYGQVPSYAWTNCGTQFIINCNTIQTYGPFSVADGILLSAYASHTKNQDAIDASVIQAIGDLACAHAGIKLLNFTLSTNIPKSPTMRKLLPS